MLTAFNRYLKEFEKYYSEHPEQRCGQAASNTLSIFYPNLASELNGTNKDPFYDDTRLDAFFAIVRKQLNTEV